MASVPCLSDKEAALMLQYSFSRLQPPSCTFLAERRSVQLSRLYRTGTEHSNLAESHLVLRHFPHFSTLHPGSRVHGWPQDIAPEPGGRRPAVPDPLKPRARRGRLVTAREEAPRGQLFLPLVKFRFFPA